MAEEEEETGQDAHLIRASSHESEVFEAAAAGSEENPPTAFVWALTVVAGISGLLFGYE